MRVEEKILRSPQKDSRNATKRLKKRHKQTIKINIQLSTQNLFGKAESINLIDKFSKQSVLIRQKIKS